MATKSIAWNTGSGNINVEYGGSKDGTIVVTSDNNNLYESRSQQITVRTTDGSNISRTVTISQAAKVRIDISSATVSASNQTYSGSAKTPTPTVTLNGSTIPSSGYDVSYSNNTNAGTATITITGKGEYTGTATGTFNIAKASRTLSFADSYVVLNTSSNVTKTATPSAGSGDGAITYSISSTTYATINSSSGKVTSKTSDGSAIVTATIAEGANYLSASTSYNLYVFATTHSYSYSGSYSSITLPPGTYQFQCWGAQGGSNGTNSSYGITAKAGGKGGYAVGQLTVSQNTAVRVYVGGQGSASAGGFNGGGSTTGTSQYSSGGELGYSKMGGGGGATDIRLSDGALLSRMIVAGGGSGGAMCYKAVTTTTTETRSIWPNASGFSDYGINDNTGEINTTSLPHYRQHSDYIDINNFVKITYDTFAAVVAGGYIKIGFYWYNSSYGYISTTPWYTSNGEITPPSNARYVRIVAAPNPDQAFWIDYDNRLDNAINLTLYYTETSTSTSTNSQVGYVGGGTTGGGYSDFYKGKQNSAGSNGSFGNGGNADASAFRYCSGGGGGGWYGGGRYYSDTVFDGVKYSGGGSGFVNTYANRSYRPSGYTGLQLDSGSTTAGSSSFPSTSGGNETGHAGNGYARITRLN